MSNIQVSINAAYLREARAKKGITQQKLADLSGLHVLTIREIEQGRKKTPSLTTIAKIKNAIDLDLEKLITITANKMS